MRIGKPLHKTLPGAVVAQYRTAGGKIYGPYWVRVWRSGGKVRKAYVKAHELAEVRAACEANRTLRAKRAASRRETKRLLGDFTFLMRTLARADRAPEGGEVPMSEGDWSRLERIRERGIGR